MNHYWPNRPDPKGFSIETLAKRYRERLANSDFESERTKDHKNDTASDYLQLNKEDGLKKTIQSNNEHTTHWANRYFDEYHDVA